MSQQPSPEYQVQQERLRYGGATVILALVGAFLSPLLFAATIPLGILTYRQGMRVGTVTALLAGLVAGMLSLAALVIVVVVLALGLTLGAGLREKVAPLPLFGIGTVVTLVIFLLLGMASQAVLGVNPVEESFASFEQMVDEIAEGPIARQLSSEEIDRFRAAMLAQAEWLRQTLPGHGIVAAVVLTFFGLAGIRRGLGTDGEQLPWFPPFQHWRFPASMALIFVAVGWLGDHWAAVVGNIQVVLGAAFVVHGLAVADYFLLKWRLPRSLIIVLAVFALAFAWLYLVMLGLLDAVFNIRRLQVSKGPKEDSRR